MALDTLEHSMPPFFRQGLPALAKWLLLTLLALLLMSTDHRVGITSSLRSGISVLLSPLQWLTLLPQRAGGVVQDYFKGVDEARDAARQYQIQTITHAQRLQKTEQLAQENEHLRQLLQLRQDVAGPSKAVQALYETPALHTQRLVVDKGQVSGVVSGSAVIDVAGVVGQVTRVYPLSSEVTLLTDRDQSIPVLNVRTGQRFVAMGDPSTLGGSLELRFVPANADVQKDDLLTTSGIDGIYPAGLHVARVAQIDRLVDTAFAKVHALPMARVRGRHMLILSPAADAPEPLAHPGAATAKTATPTSKSHQVPPQAPHHAGPTP